MGYIKCYSLDSIIFLSAAHKISFPNAFRLKKKEKKVPLHNMFVSNVSVSHTKLSFDQ